jgi:hypothetical protein
VDRYAARFTMRSTLLCSHCVARFGSMPRSLSRLAMPRRDSTRSCSLRTARAVGARGFDQCRPQAWPPTPSLSDEKTALRDLIDRTIPLVQKN